MSLVEDKPLAQSASKAPSGPPAFQAFAHVSLPCRDLEQGKKFYIDVMGGKLRVNTSTFCAVTVCGTEIGIGTEGATFIEPGNEYPHFAFYCGPREIQQMKNWLTRCGIPTSNFWTRSGVETLMFFRDPSGNMIELFCSGGVPGSDKFPKGPPHGHGTAVDIETLRYDSFHVPD
jgi:catechol 2,3-dioxygenase-like lactoylglutathione lyase family enzyme